jgi:TonB-dependent receptor
MQEWSALGTQFLSLLGFMDYNYRPVNFLNGNYELGPVSDVSLLHGVYELLLPHDVMRNDWSASLLNDYSGNEEYGARYIMVDLKLGSRINFITGGRYEKNITTYTSTQGYAGISSWMEYSSNRVTHSRINEFWLPNYMLRIRPTDWFDIRFAQTHTLSRPNYTQILPFWYVRPTSVSWKNADLKVARSLNNDLYFSVNQQHIGLLTLGVFTKRIKDLIFSVGKKLIIDPEEYGLDEDVKKRFIYGVTMNNPFAVEMQGMEVDWQTRFWYLPGFWNGFVLNMNYTYIHSEAQYPRTEIVTTYYFEPSFRAEMTNVDTFYTDRMIDQPNNIANIAIGYDRKGFSARLSMLHISQVFQRTDFWKELRQSTDDYTRWDLSVKQDLPWYGLQIYGNINNITGSVDRNLVKGKGFPSSEQHYGRTADIGLRLRL